VRGRRERGTEQQSGVHAAPAVRRRRRERRGGAAVAPRRMHVEFSSTSTPTRRSSSQLSSAATTSFGARDRVWDPVWPLWKACRERQGGRRGGRRISRSRARQGRRGLHSGSRRLGGGRWICSSWWWYLLEVPREPPRMQGDPSSDPNDGPRRSPLAIHGGDPITHAAVVRGLRTHRSTGDHRLWQPSPQHRSKRCWPTGTTTDALYLSQTLLTEGDDGPHDAARPAELRRSGRTGSLSAWPRPIDRVR